MNSFKKTLLLSVTAVLTVGLGLTAQQVINVGSSPNDHTGDTLRASLVKTNDNFTEVYGKFPVTLADGGTGGTSAATARTALGLQIGLNTQAWDADLDAIAALTPTNDDVMQRKSGAWANRTIAQLKTDIGTVATSTALAANGANCSANNAALGVDASGASEGCFAPYVPGGTDVAIADGGTASSTAATARTALAVPGLADANTFTNALPITISSTEPRDILSDSDQGSDLKAWDWDLNAGVLAGRTRTDADGAGKNWIAITRGTTTAISDVSIGNATDNPTISLLGTGDVAIGGQLFLNGGLSHVAGTAPAVRWVETDAGTNLKRWTTDVNASVWSFRTITDANATGKDIWTVTRGATTAVASMAFGNATDNPTYAFTGTGAATFSGLINGGKGIVSTGTKFTTSGCSISSTTGGAQAGKFTLGANTCTAVITINGATGATAPNGWACHASDQTSALILVAQSSSTTTTASLSVPATAGTTDVISFSCMGY